jgi:hypothetical protein
MIFISRIAWLCVDMRLWRWDEVSYILSEDDYICFVALLVVRIP